MTEKEKLLGDVATFLAELRGMSAYYQDTNREVQEAVRSAFQRAADKLQGVIERNLSNADEKLIAAHGTSSSVLSGPELIRAASEQIERDVSQLDQGVAFYSSTETKRREDCQLSGWTAFGEGKDNAANPYEVGSVEHDWWLEGLFNAKRAGR